MQDDEKPWLTPEEYKRNSIPLTNLRELKQPNDVFDTIQNFANRTDQMKGCICLGLLKNDGFAILTSSMSIEQKAALIAFANAYMGKQFMIGDV